MFVLLKKFLVKTNRARFSLFGGLLGCDFALLGWLRLLRSVNGARAAKSSLLEVGSVLLGLDDVLDLLQSAFLSRLEDDAPGAFRWFVLQRKKSFVSLLSCWKRVKSGRKVCSV